jgi:hypothetical protein
MSIYGESANRFEGDGGYVYRPRPTLARLALVAFAQLILAAWLSTSLVSLIDTVVLRVSGMKDVWPVYATPWSTVKTELSRYSGEHGSMSGGYSGEYLRADPLFDKSAAWIAGSLIAIAAFVLLLWPGGLTLSSRLFAAHLAMVLAAIGTASSVRTCLAYYLCDIPPMSTPVALALTAAGLAVATLAELRAVQTLSNVFDLRRASRRLALWFVRLVPACIALAVAAFFGELLSATYAYIVLFIVTFFASALWRPRRRYEEIVAPELREAAIALPLLAVALLAACVFTFGFGPLRPPRALVVRSNGARFVSWSTLPSTLRWEAPPPAVAPKPKEKKLDIHWTTEEERRRRRH